MHLVIPNIIQIVPAATNLSHVTYLIMCVLQKMKQFTEIPSLRSAIIVILASLVASQLVTSASARYLPTRSQDDRLDKLRELLKDVSFHEVQKCGKTKSISLSITFCFECLPLISINLSIQVDIG